jgi:hypothetical protein
MKTEFPIITVGHFINGFVDWYVTNFETVQPLFTEEVKELFDSVEDFAIEIFFELKTA